MKKYFLSILIATTLLTSCRITKTFTLINAKGASNRSEIEFLRDKAESVAFLNLSEEQKEKALVVWQTEKQKLGNAYDKKNKEIAPIIYDSEIDFRDILTEEQLKSYKEKYKGQFFPGYLNDKQLSELKRIYDL